MHRSRTNGERNSRDSRQNGNLETVSRLETVFYHVGLEVVLVLVFKSRVFVLPGDHCLDVGLDTECLEPGADSQLPQDDLENCHENGVLCA